MESGKAWVHWHYSTGMFVEYPTVMNKYRSFIGMILIITNPAIEFFWNVKATKKSYPVAFDGSAPWRGGSRAEGLHKVIY
jgi:hypothetical protein